MTKAILSKVLLDDMEQALASLFRDCVGDLMETEEVQGLSDYTQHCNTSRLQHSVNVAYYSFLLCRKLRLDYRSAARAGILHDLFLYDWRTERQTPGLHAFAHPKVALENARRITVLNKLEEDAIVNHMWPVTPAFPKFIESYIVSFADKYCAYVEFIDGIIKGVIKRFPVLSRIFSERIAISRE